MAKISSFWSFLTEFLQNFCTDNRMARSVIKPKLQKRYEQKCILNFTSLRVELNFTFYSSSVRNTSLTTYNNVIASLTLLKPEMKTRNDFSKGYRCTAKILIPSRNVKITI